MESSNNFIIIKTQRGSPTCYRVVRRLPREVRINTIQHQSDGGTITVFSNYTSKLIIYLELTENYRLKLTCSRYAITRLQHFLLTTNDSRVNPYFPRPHPPPYSTSTSSTPRRYTRPYLSTRANPGAVCTPLNTPPPDRHRGLLLSLSFTSKYSS